MTDVVIHRCSLRVVRRSGWSWGPDPQDLLRGAVNALPQLLAKALKQLGPLSGQRGISAPIRLDIPIRLDELRSMSSNSFTSHAVAPGPSLLNTRIAHALTNALAAHGVAAKSVESNTQGNNETAKKAAELSPRRRAGGALPELLFLWFEQGSLENRLSKFSLASLEAWHRALINGTTKFEDVGSGSSMTEIVGLVEESLLDIATNQTDRAAIIRKRIAIAIKTMSMVDPPRVTLALREALDRVLPLPGHELEEVERALSRAAGSSVADPLKTHQRGRPTNNITTAFPDGEIPVTSVLPFLLLGPLSRMGYLAVLAATLEVIELTELTGIFATALAYKVLDPPERGWLRGSGVMRTASAFGAQTETTESDELNTLASVISSHLSPLDSLICDSLLEGHSPRAPLILQQIDDEIVLFDVDGLFPIVAVDRPEKLFPVLEQCPSSAVLIPSSLADPALFDKLARAGHRFITDVPPTRGEKWRRVNGHTHDRWWTNDTVSPATVLSKSAQRLEQSALESSEALDELFSKRPLARPGIGKVLDRHLSFVAAVALGTISWTLWNHREPTNPQLALQRFGDLDGTVRFTPDRVRVRLPMGRRFQDLYEHKLLDEIADVPWFDGRVLQFSGG